MARAPRTPSKPKRKPAKQLDREIDVALAKRGVGNGGMERVTRERVLVEALAIEIDARGARSSHHSSIAKSKVPKEKGGGGGPRVLKISRGKIFAGQRSITADVQYPGEPPSRVEFVGPSASIGGPGPVVMISRGHQTFVTDPSRFGDFGPEWVRRFFASA